MNNIFVGEDEFREKLIALGFTIYYYGPDNINSCNWLGSRAITKEIRNCESNEKKPNLIVIPFSLSLFNGQISSSVEADITGEVNKIWYKLKAYGLSKQDFLENVESIESSLVKSWNVLHGNL